MTNNEFMAWVVKGYIAELMGCSIDWAGAAASTTHLQAGRVERDLLKQELCPEDIATLIELSR